MRFEVDSFQELQNILDKYNNVNDFMFSTHSSIEESKESLRNQIKDYLIESNKGGDGNVKDIIDFDRIEVELPKYKIYYKK